MSAPIWKTKTLADMTAREWESLCDGCGKCCLVKLEDEGTGHISYTDVACGLLNTHTCRCRDYHNRTQRIADCVKLSPKSVSEFHWLPSTCAYRLVAEGKDLPWWHPLVSGDSETVHQAGMSVRGRVVAKRNRVNIHARIVQWPE
ncbi:MAG: YcgN family cysteine cluster protein [Pseudomonadota bacterium]|nr:YcgN family cysteine cluster protein [Pseudomonadota bacterium]